MSKFAFLSKLIILICVVYFFLEYTQVSESIKFIISSFCILLFVSPKMWFWLKSSILNVFNRIEKAETPDKVKFNLLIMLFYLRYLEVYNTYDRMRHEQQEAGSENWILEYLKKEARYLGDFDYFSNNKDRKIKEIEEKAKSLFDKLFYFEKFSFDVDKTIKNSMDLEVDFFDLLSLNKLKLIRSFGCFKSELTQLIKNYEFIEETYQEGFSRFTDFYINRIGKYERRSAYRSIGENWQKLLNILKTYLIFFEIQEGPNDLYNSLFKDIEVLEEMTNSLGFALRKPNAQKGHSIGSPRVETEKAFFARYDSNSLWSKSFL